MKVLCVIMLLGLLITGCVRLTPELRAKFKSAQADLDAARKEAELLAGKLIKVGVQLKEAKARIEAGGTAAVIAEAKKLYETYKAEEAGIKASFERAMDRGTAAVGTIEEIRAAGVPWYQVAGNVLLNSWEPILGGLLLLLGGKKYVTMRRHLGALSRAGNATAGFSENLVTEIPLSPGVSEDSMRVLHHAATARNI